MESLIVHLFESVMYSGSLKSIALLLKSTRCFLRSPARSVSDNTHKSFPCLIMTSDGTVTRSSLTFEDCKKEGMHVRDFFALNLFADVVSAHYADQNVNLCVTSQFFCLPRSKFIITSMGNIKSIIYSDRVIIFNHFKPVVDLWTEELADRLPSFPHDSPSSSFELSILEEILREMCDMYDRRLRLLTPLANNLLMKINDEYDAFEGSITHVICRPPDLTDRPQVYKN